MKKKKIDTKTKIKNASIELFNTQDTLSITTNHIAKQANISPGNLYYHYKNKEEIIVSIYEDLSKEFVSLNSFEKMISEKNAIKTMNLMFDEIGKLFYEYRFLLRDSAVLIALYPSLKEMFIKNQEQRIFQITMVLKYLMKEKILENIEDEKLLNKRAKLQWFISAYWQVFVSTNGKVTKESIKEAKEIFFEFMIIPSLTKKGKELLKEYKDEA